MGLPKTIRRVTLLGDDEPVVLYRRKRKKRRSSLPLVPGEAFVRRVTRGLERSAQTYLSAHRDSNREARDGWLTDLGPNVFKAGRKGLVRIARGMRD